MDWFMPKQKPQAAQIPVIPQPGESEAEKELARRQRASLFILTSNQGVTDNRKMMGPK